MTRVITPLVAVLLIGSSLPVFAQDIQFSEMENLPEARSALTSANNGEDIFIVNGFGVDEPYVDEIYQYDVDENTWSVLTSSTLPKRYASAAIVGDYLYVFNGVTVTGALNSMVEKIDLNTGIVELLSDNPFPARTAGVAAWNDKIYSFGGTTAPSQYSNKLYEFDPALDTWTELADIPFAGETKGEIVDGKLYIIGGFNGSVSDRIDVYDMASGTWEANFTMPVGISANATAVVGSKIYLVGDFSNLTLLASFDTSDNTFQLLNSNLNPRRHGAAEGVGGALFAIGGNTTSNINSAIASVQKADLTTSVTEVNLVRTLDVFPNPTSTILHLNQRLDEAIVFDNQGRAIQRFRNVVEVDVASLQAGVYYVRGFSGRDTFQARFVKF
jgi:hypothetical protein